MKTKIYTKLTHENPNLKKPFSEKMINVLNIWDRKVAYPNCLKHYFYKLNFQT